MNRYLYLYTPWREQGLSYDAKVIENIALKNGFNPLITYRTKRKIERECDFIPINQDFFKSDQSRLLEIYKPDLIVAHTPLLKFLKHNKHFSN